MPSASRLPLLLAALGLAGCAGAPVPSERAQGGDAPLDLARLALVDRSEVPSTSGEIEAAFPAAAAVAARWGRLPAEVRIVVHPDQAALRAAIGLGEAGDALAWARDGVVDLVAPARWPGRPASKREVSLILAHELTHLVLYRALGPDDRWVTMEVPSWFREGMASVTAGERYPAPPRGALRPGARPAAIQAGAHHAFLRLQARHGEAGVRRLVARLGDGLHFPQAFEAALGTPLPRFERELARSGLLPTSGEE